MSSERRTTEFCHNRLDPYGKWCGKPAEFIVWGKLFPPDALGPRCYDCAAGQIGHHALQHDSGYAVYSLSRLSEVEEAAKEAYALLINVTGKATPNGPVDLAHRAHLILEAVLRPK